MSSLLRINTNQSALFSSRLLGESNQRLAEAQERLSSGVRINSASDDAAGLAISEKIETQSRGLKQALQYMQDGMSLLQTAESAYGEIYNSLQRMRELAVQTSNDTLTQEDRENLNKEQNQLMKEINRIADQTQFNTKRLIDPVDQTEEDTLNERGSVIGRLKDAIDQLKGGSTSETVTFNLSFIEDGKTLDDDTADPGDTTTKVKDQVDGSVDEEQFQKRTEEGLEEWGELCEHMYPGLNIEVRNLGVEDSGTPDEINDGSSYDLDQDGDGTIEEGEVGDFRVGMHGEDNFDDDPGIFGHAYYPGGDSVLGETGSIENNIHYDADEDWRDETVNETAAEEGSADGEGGRTLLALKWLPFMSLVTPLGSNTWTMKVQL